ncbi:MAG: YceI family protein [Bdellovibrionaceae bacterium]|nr:YceI family protein [Bdellovibrionales bacterium]MCB9084485.1 YceI family protein [Pseudobdellovibrionaceae bacterium]
MTVGFGKQLSLLVAAVAVTLMTQTASAAAVAQAGQYEIDGAHTNIGFEVSHLGFSLVVGRFNTFSGHIQFNPNGESSVVAEIDVASVDTNQKRRDQHLRSPDFFDASRFPKMRYQSTSVDYDQDGNPKTVHGTLSLHGVEKEVSLAVTPIGAGQDPFGDVRTGYQAKALIKRSDFGMSNLLAVAGDEVAITINIEGILQ